MFRLTAFLPEWVAAHPRLAATLASALIVAATVTWRMGGLEAAPPKALPVFREGATIITNEWKLRPLRAWISSTDPINTYTRGNFLIVELIAENRTSQSSTSVTQALRLLHGNENPDDDATRQGTTPVLVLLRDPSYGGTVHPGIPERLAATWKLPAGAPPTQAHLRVIGREWVERDSLIGGSGWLRDHVVAEVRFTLTDRRQPATRSTP